MAVSWDPDKVKAAGRATAEEVSCTGVHWTFSPVLCIARDTRWGRVDETFGEDPMLIGELASAMVKGYQDGAKAGEELPKNAILACAKHFAGYSETQGGRDASEADLSHRKLESWFLPPFERVAKEGCGTFMLGYESIEGVPVTFNKWLLTDKLRGAWKYNGTLITDWDNVGRSVWEAARQTRLRARRGRRGQGRQRPDHDHAEVLRRCHRGREDRPSRRIADRRRRFAHPGPEVPPRPVRGPAPAGRRTHQGGHRFRRTPANQPGTRPRIHSTAAQRRCFAVRRKQGQAHRRVGPLADDAQNQLGDWTGNSGQVSWMPDGQPRDMITHRARRPDPARRRRLRGRLLARGERHRPRARPRRRVLPGRPAPPEDRRLRRRGPGPDRRGRGHARQSDLIVAVVGDVVQLVGETCSTATLELLGGQNALLDALAAVSRETGKPMVTVLISSKPQVLPASIVGESSVFAKRVSDPETGTGSILWAPNPGMRGGQAIAEIILGLTSPSGRLPITFPRHAGQLPVYYNQIRGQHGDRYADLTQDPAFAFGEGLSYTTFAYGEPTITGGASNADGTFAETDTVRAESPSPHRRARGVEIMQAYIGDIVTSYSWTDRELRRSSASHWNPGETKTVTFEIPGGELHDRGPGRQPHRRARRIRTAHRPLLAP